MDGTEQLQVIRGHKENSQESERLLTSTSPVFVSVFGCYPISIQNNHLKIDYAILFQD